MKCTKTTQLGGNLYEKGKDYDLTDGEASAIKLRLGRDIFERPAPKSASQKKREAIQKEPATKTETKPKSPAKKSKK